MTRAFYSFVVAVLLVSCSGAPPAGPLGQPGDAWGWSTSQSVGDRFADGFGIIAVPDGVEVVVRDVEPLMTGEGLEMLGAMIAGPEREPGAIQQFHSWPPDDPQLGAEPFDAIGATLDGAATADFPGRGFELIVGYEVVAAGRSTVQGYRVTYEHEGRLHSLVLGAGLAVCAVEDGEPLPDDCEPEHTIRYDHRIDDVINR